MNGTVPTPKTRDFARRLVAYEAAAAATPGFGADRSVAFRVAEKLRRPLSRLTGTSGFRSLMARALSLAKTQSNSLSAVQIQPDGSLEGMNELRDEDAEEAGAMLIAYLLGLLNTFIGEQLTERLVQDEWPNLPVNVQRSGEAEST
jgi:hypothetical protein